jgi:glutamate/tyrosine decarboxylase-like PLP-dependent enzyme
MNGADDLAALERAASEAVAYRRGVQAARSTPTASYAQMLTAFDGPTPESADDAEAVIADLAAKATPGIRAMTGPRFFGWVIGGSHPVGVAADWLTSAWGQNAGNQMAAPAAAAAEAVAGAWLLDILSLPREASIGFVTGATVANFVALAAARGAVLRRVGWDVEAEGLFGAPPIDVLVGEEAHATVFSGLRFLGLGADRVHRIGVDDEGAISIEAFSRALDRCTGPVIAIAQAGQINTGAFDPVREMAPLVAARGGWLHVDGAFGLWARASPSLAHLGRGLERADSWATDGHKWLQTPYDCGFAIVRDGEARRRAMTISASYLPPAEGAEHDPSQYVPELSRRARGFSVWAMIRRLGRAGIAEMVERDCALARRMAGRLGAEAGISVVNRVVLNQVVVRFGAGGGADAATLAVVRRVQEDAICFVGPAQWRGRWVMRISVTSAATTPADADLSCDAIIAAWRAVGGGLG